MDFTELEQSFEVAQLRTINEEQYNFIINNSFPTGSQVVGDSHAGSDWDYVMLESVYQTRFSEPYNQYNDTFGTSSVKVQYNNKTINILVARSKFEYDAWVFANKEYIRITNGKIKDKELRVKLFNALRETFLTTSSK